jgi:hypothetical protein
MKNWILGFILASCLLVAQGCSNREEAKSRADTENVIAEEKVPAAVKTAFTTKYPGASQIIWEEATEGSVPTIKVKFKRDDKYWKAEFRQDGSFVKDNEDYK